MGSDGAFGGSAPVWNRRRDRMRHNQHGAGDCPVLRGAGSWGDWLFRIEQGGEAMSEKSEARAELMEDEKEALGENMGVTRRVVQKYINVLKESGRIERVGGKRYGYWKIND